MSTIRIARVAFASRTLDAAMEEETDPAYAAFVAPHPHLGDEVVTVDVRIGAPPGGEDFVTRFDSGRSWTLAQSPDGQTQHLRLIHDKQARRPLCTAALDATLSSVTLWCAPEMIRHGRLPSLVHYPLDQLMLMMKLARTGGVILHAVAAVKEGRAIVLAGRSGAGKTTVARLLEDTPGVTLLSDDRVVLRVEEGRIYAYGTPWPGEGGHARNERFPLAGLGFLTKATTTCATSLDRTRALERLLPVASIPWFDAALVESSLGTTERIVTTIPTFDFAFAPHEEAIVALNHYFTDATTGAGSAGPVASRAPDRRRSEHGAVP